MKFLTSTGKVLLVAAISLPLAFQLHAQQTLPVGGSSPVKSRRRKDREIHRQRIPAGLYTRDPVYDDEGLVGWNNDNYRIVPESGTHARTWFDRRPLALDLASMSLRR